MPIKFSPSVVRVDRNTKKTTIEHDYMKVKPLKELLEYFNKTDNPPKKRQKVKNELVRRTKKGLANIVFKWYKYLCDNYVTRQSREIEEQSRIVTIHYRR